MIKYIKPIIFTASPFILFSIWNTATGHWLTRDIAIVKFTIIVVLFLSLLLIFLQFLLRDRNYFPLTVTLFFLTWLLMLSAVPSEQIIFYLNSGSIYSLILRYPQVGLYGFLFLMAAVPQLVGLPSFSTYFAKVTTPEPFHGSSLLKKVSDIISFFWAILFILCIGAQFIPLLALQITLPILIQVAIGIPGTKFLIPYLQKKYAKIEHGVIRDYLTTAYDSISGMPYIFDTNAAKGINAVYQFQITGSEKFSAYLHITNETCTFHEGTHLNPTMTIHSPADVWLAISRREMDGAEAFLENKYQAEGDLSYLISMQDMFDSDKNNSSPSDTLNSTKKTISVHNEYATLTPKSVKSIVAIIGSPRKKGISKTDVITQMFLEGCSNAGAEVSTIFLKDKNINPCIGCFTCWTSTPGKCIYNDDVEDIINAEFQADLIIYAFPLYHFGINSLTKMYIERTLPILEPFFKKGDNEKTYHPIREKYRKKRNFILISACGLPEASHFDALSNHLHTLISNSQADTAAIVAEIYRPSSETINIPFYSKEHDRVQNLLQEAGKQIVTHGKIESDIISSIREVQIDNEKLHRETNLTWKKCIEEKKTLSQIQQEFIKEFK